MPNVCDSVQCTDNSKQYTYLTVFKIKELITMTSNTYAQKLPSYCYLKFTRRLSDIRGSGSGSQTLGTAYHTIIACRIL